MKKLYWFPDGGLFKKGDEWVDISRDFKGFCWKKVHKMYFGSKIGCHFFVGGIRRPIKYERVKKGGKRK